MLGVLVREDVEAARDHLLEAFHCPVHLRSRGDVVLDLVDEWREGDAPRVGGRIFAAEY